MRSYLGYRYAIVPSLLELREFRKNINWHYQKTGNDAEEATAVVVRDTEERLQSQYYKKETMIFRNND